MWKNAKNYVLQKVFKITGGSRQKKLYQFEKNKEIFFLNMF